MRWLDRETLMTPLRLSLALPLLLAFAMSAFAMSAGAMSAGADPARARIEACLEDKAPEGLPTEGPLRDKMVKAMEGGPQACVGLVEQECRSAGGDRKACVAQETAAWLSALARPDLAGKRAAVWRKAAIAVKAQAIALCEASAAGSAWGGEKVAAQGRYGFKVGDACVRDAVAGQALILLVNARGV